MDYPASRPLSIETGAIVTAGDQQIGIVEEVVADPSTGTPSQLLVYQTADASYLRIPIEQVDTAASTATEVRLIATPADLSTYQDTGHREGIKTKLGATLADGELFVPVHEEVLVPTTREISLGEVVIRKRVEQVPSETTVNVGHDEVLVERVAVNQRIDTAPAPRQEGDTLVVPVVEEVLVTEKRLMLREEVRITRRRRTEQVTVSDTVRREVLDVEENIPTSAQGSPESTTVDSNNRPLA